MKSIVGKRSVRSFVAAYLSLSLMVSACMPASADIRIDRIPPKPKSELDSLVEKIDPEMEFEAMQKRSNDLEATPTSDKLVIPANSQSFFEAKLKSLQSDVEKARAANNALDCVKALTELSDFYYKDYDIFDKAEIALKEAVELASKVPMKPDPFPANLLARIKLLTPSDKKLQARLEKACLSLDKPAIRQAFTDAIAKSELEDGPILRIATMKAIEDIRAKSTTYPRTVEALARLHARKARHKEALSEFQLALDAASQEYGAHNRWTCRFKDALASEEVTLSTTIWSTGDEALNLKFDDKKTVEGKLFETLKQRQTSFGPSLETAAALRVLGTYYRAIKAHSESEKYYADAVDMIFCVEGGCVQEEADALHELAGPLYMQERYALGEQCDRKGLSISARLHKTYDRTVDTSFDFFVQTISNRPGRDNKNFARRQINLRAEVFGIGSDPVRDVLNRLESDGLLTKDDLQFVEQAISVRKVLQCKEDIVLADLLLLKAKIFAMGRDRESSVIRKAFAEAYEAYKNCNKLQTPSAARAFVECLEFEAADNQTADSEIRPKQRSLSIVKAKLFEHLNLAGSQPNTKVFDRITAVENLSWALRNFANNSSLNESEQAELAVPIVEACKKYSKEAIEGADWMGSAELNTLLYTLYREDQYEDLLTIVSKSRKKLTDSGLSDHTKNLLRIAQSLYRKSMEVGSAASIDKANNQLAILTGDSRLKIWDLASKKQKSAIEKSSSTEVSYESVAFEGNLLAVGATDGTIILLNADGTLVDKLCPTVEKAASKWQFEKWSNEEATSQSDKNLRATVVPRGIRIYNSADQRTISLIRFPFGSPRPTSISFDSKGQALAANIDASTKVYDVKSGTMIESGTANPPAIRAVEISPDGNTIVSAGDWGLMSWTKSSSGKWTSKLLSKTSVSNLAINKDGSLIACAQGNTVTLWDAKGGSQIRMFERLKDPTDISFSPNGKLLAASTKGLIMAWELADGKSILITPSSDATASTGNYTTAKMIAFSEDSKSILSLNFDGVLTSWNVDSRKQTAKRNLGRSNESIALFSPGTAEIISIRDSVRSWKAPFFEGSAPATDWGCLMEDQKAAHVRSYVTQAANLWNECERTAKAADVNFVNEQVNDLGTSMAASFKSIVVTQSTQRTARKKMFILSIGIEDGHWGLKDQIKCPSYTHDSKVISESIKTRCRDDYENIEEITLSNQQANMSGILRAFDEIAQKTEPQDTFTLVYSGMPRGYKDVIGLTPYVAPRSPRNYWPEDKCSADQFSITVASREAGIIALEKDSTAGGIECPIDDFGFTPLCITPDVLNEQIKRVKANKQLFIFNAGGSDSFAQGLSEEREYGDDKIARLTLAVDGWGYAITDPNEMKQDDSGKELEEPKYSADAKQSTDTKTKPELKTSAFTTVLLDGLAGKADSTGSGKIAAFELWAYFNGEGNLNAQELGMSLRALKPSHNFPICDVQEDAPTTKTAKSLPRPKKIAQEVLARLQSKNLAVLIGTNDYEDSDQWSRLANPEDDVDQLAKIFEEYYGWEVKKVKHPSNKELREVIDEITNLDYGDGQLFVYISGHGCFLPRKRMGFIVTRDSKLEDPTTMLSHCEIQAQLSRGDCKHVVLALDTCFAGTLLPDVAKTMTLNMKTKAPNGPDIYADASLEKICKQTAGYDSYRLLAPAIGPAYDGQAGKNSPFAGRLLKVLTDGVAAKRDPPFLRFPDLADAALKTVGESSTGVSGDFAPSHSLGEFLVVRKSAHTTPTGEIRKPEERRSVLDEQDER